MKKALVRDYMTKDVVTLSPTLTVREAIERIVREGHVGLPIAEGRRLVGFITPKELLRHLHEQEKTLAEIMAKGTPVAHPDMDLEDAARVLFRLGIKELPVVDEEGNLVGIISTTDVIRSHIERATPRKMLKLKETLEHLYGLTVTVEEELFPLRGLLPTQRRIYADELEGRKKEIRKGLAEPIIVIDKRPQPILVDGHHRVLAALELGLDRLQAYVLRLSADVELGLERNAKASGLRTLDDIEVNDVGQHPLVEITTRLMVRERKEG